METWVFESRSHESECILVRVHARDHVSGWDRATQVLKVAGHTPTHTNGRFGFATRGAFLHQEGVEEGIILPHVLQEMCG